ncbi:hypothetical protein C7C56_006075 [Massilia glaciei]|uniref:Lipoprotein n=1 Tax=Massilia glaciei TaxID=1524097 RepID=A0A2U2I4Q4_9BURK|nr:hypothetical protein C7C56_006075 [Massilia glaciei]
MRTPIMLCLGAALLAGCATPAERAAQMQEEMKTAMFVYGPACSKLGYNTNSDPWRDCVLSLSTKEDMERYGYPHYYAGYGRSHWGFGAGWGPYW